MSDLYRDYLAHLAKVQKVEVGPATSESLNWLAAHQTGAVELHQLQRVFWPLQSLMIGPYAIHPVSEWAHDPCFELLFKCGHLQIGAAGNGDPLVVKLSSKWTAECEIGLVNHEEFSIDGNGNELASCYIKICDDFWTLLYRAVEEKYLPSDFYCAIEHVKQKERA